MLSEYEQGGFGSWQLAVNYYNLAMVVLGRTCQVDLDLSG